jgi:hypothetical protein
VPTWAWILVTLLAALGSGLIGTLARITHDRGAERRHHTMEALEAFSGSATEWFDAVNRAIDDRLQAGFSFDAPQEAMRAAEMAMQDARRKANRLQVLVPWQSEIGRAASEVTMALETSIAELREWPPLVDDADDADPAAEDGEDERGNHEYDPWGELIEATIAEAMLWHEAGLQAFRKFTQVAAEELHRSLVRDLSRRWRPKRLAHAEGALPRKLFDPRR